MEKSDEKEDCQASRIEEWLFGPEAEDLDRERASALCEALLKRMARVRPTVGWRGDGLA